MNILNFDSKLDLDKIDSEIEHNRIKLERLISSQDANSTAIDELEKQVAQINEILFRLNHDKSTDPNSLLEKSRTLRQIKSILIETANKYQESLSETLLHQIKHIGLWFQGTAKLYEIDAFTKQTSEPTEENVIHLIKLVTVFVTDHWETHPEEILEREKTALDIADAIKLKKLDKIPDRTKEIIHKFVSTTLSAADKVRLKELKDLSPAKEYSITDFRGIGADLLNGVDATAWVRGLRDEWSERGGLKES